MADFVGESLAKALDNWHFLQGQRALKVLTAVQAAAQHEVTVQQCAGLAKNVQGVGARHTRIKEEGVSEDNRIQRMANKTLFGEESSFACLATNRLVELRKSGWTMCDRRQMEVKQMPLPASAGASQSWYVV